MNKRKRGRAKRPTKASVAASGVASGDGTAGGPTGAAAVSAATGSALSQRRKYIMNLTEARSIGKRPSPMFTNFCYFKAQDARVLPLERLPAAQVRQAGKQGCGSPIVGMVYPRLTTSSEAVARLALEPLKWRGLLENCVSVAQARPPPAHPLHMRVWRTVHAPVAVHAHSACGTRRSPGACKAAV